MADISVTATSVVPGSDCNIADGIAGVTIAAGQSVYLEAATNTLKLAIANSTVALAAAVGIALNGGAAGQTIRYAKGGTVTMGATLVAGKPYVVSATAGGIAPHADLVSTNKVTFLGYATTTGILQVVPNATGLAVA